MDLRQYFPGGSPALPLQSSVSKTLTLSKSASPHTGAHSKTRAMREVASGSQLDSLRGIEALYYLHRRSIVGGDGSLTAPGSSKGRGSKAVASKLTALGT